MNVNIFPVRIAVKKLTGPLVDDNTHTVTLTDRAGSEVELFGSIEQVEDWGHTLLNYVRGYNADEMIKMRKRMEANE